jgi:hypothetical protein
MRKIGNECGETENEPVELKRSVRVTSALDRKQAPTRVFSPATLFG